MSIVGERLKDLKEKNGLDNNDLALLSGLTPSDILNIEYGVEVTQTQIELLSKALNISPLYFLGIDTSSNQGIEARMRVQGEDNIDLKKAIDFASNFIEKIQNLKRLEHLP
ncbi:helix-turn-helix transcriptional regulator [Aeribacillus pallidus]|jgi:transcriptional regulator with XRE-family HTH domain|uniref:helix-turn-helix domain-containing protein n=1 Tax=Aeribacillus composti TaxID=1868734 RepID=UPI002E1C4818|nr:helix-turn-helix transcriptional regulator [Aeribacillus composti]MED4488154.1 helix-turn-helix transcriptional regulator [Aeribacillus pallidus]